MVSSSNRLEKFNESEFVDDITKLGGEALKMNPAWYAKIPDRLCWLKAKNGHVIWFWAEWKRHGKEPDYGQLAYHRKLRELGHLVFVFDNNEQARQAMQDIISAN